MNLVAVETWLQEQTGLDASTLGAGVVARAARDRIAALRCERVEDYLALLASSEEERHTLVERVVVPETWFFRDRPAFDALARHAVETWGPAHAGSTFRVLCVPCSTGEEPYSLAIAFALAGWPLSHLRIDALDISRENLARARAGVYGRNSFRGGDLAFRDAFLEVSGRDAWRVGARLREPVNFEQANLLAGDFATGRGPYEAIFCRNLLIYFDRPTQVRATRALDRLLAPGGWIAVGPAEPVLFFEQGFSAVRIPGSFLVQRTPAAPPAPPSRPAPSRSAASRPPWPRATRPDKSRPAPKAPSLPVPPSPPLSPSLSSIQALADAGNLREAARRGEALLASQGPSPALLYLLGVIADAAGEAARAGELYRKVLYLEPRHADALSHLALLAEKQGDLRAARQLRQRAQRLAAREAGV